MKITPYIETTLVVVAFTAMIAFYNGGETTPHVHGALVLGDPTYDILPITAPTAAGSTLTLLSHVLTKMPVGPFLRRYLLNDNGVAQMRDLADQLPSTAPLHFPVHRLPGNERLAHEALAAAAGPISDTLKVASKSTSWLYSSDDTCAVRKQSRSHEIHQAFVENRLTPSELAESVLAATARLEREVTKVYASLNATDVRQQAAASTARYAAGEPLSILDGVPVAIKDMIDVVGHVVTDGSESRVDHPPAIHDDPIVARFRAAGAIITGVTIMTEGGVTPLGYNAYYQAPLNPHNTSHYPGGSSSGSAVAVAMGLVPIAVGFDGGGSIRTPAAMSGVVGLGFTFGRAPFNNVTSITNIKTGPLAATVADAALALAVMAPNLKGHEYNDLYDGGVPNAWSPIGGPPTPHLHGYHDESLAGVRLGMFDAWFNDADPQVVARCRRAVEMLESKGAVVVPIALPHMKALHVAHGTKIISEFALGYDSRYHSSDGGLEANTRITVGLGSSLTALEVLAGERLRAWAFNYVHSDIFGGDANVTAIVSPTTGVTAPVISEASKATGESNTQMVMNLTKFIFLGNFLGLPSMSIPVGADDSGLPVGFLLTGNHWAEASLLKIGNILESNIASGEAEAQTPKPPCYVDILRARDETDEPSYGSSGVGAEEARERGDSGSLGGAA